MFEDEPGKQKETITPGEDLSIFGLEQLSERKRVLEAEIARTEAMIASKTKGRASAEALFKKG
ncbi:MAG: DUF1192 domain-containing protein [Oceanicaulis sp.]